MLGYSSQCDYLENTDLQPPVSGVYLSFSQLQVGYPQGLVSLTHTESVFETE